MGHTLDLDQFTEEERQDIQALIQYFGQRSIEAKSTGWKKPPIDRLFTWNEIYDWLCQHADEYSFGITSDEDY